MSRYAPTLFVGLGGSGIAVLRWMRQFILEDLEHEPVKFCGIDFDRSDRPDRAAPLNAEEYFYFSPAPIAECVRAINNRVSGPPPRVAMAHEKIRLWYPDPDGHSIRYGQAETAGARQWRPLGRMGFFLYDSEIMSAVSTRLTMLEKIRGNEPPTVIVVSSVAGGTGSGMLLDVAALLRRQSPNLSIRAVLLLPEFFEHVDFGSKIAANGYATLWEIANFKNRFPFEADYPRMGTIGVQQSAPPLQRVYVVGPYLGDRRPFLSPSEGYPHIARILQTLITSTLRWNAQSFQTNDDADGNVTRADPGAAEVFCTFSSASIRLLSWKHFAMMLALGLSVEATDSTARDHPLFDVLIRPHADTAVAEIAKIVTDAVKPDQAQENLAEAVVEASLQEFFLKAPLRWNDASLGEFAKNLEYFCNEFPADSDFLSKADGPLRRSCRAIELRFTQKLDELKNRLWRHPAALNLALRQLEARLRPVSVLVPAAPVLQLDDFAKWLRRRLPHWILAVPILKTARLRVLRRHAEKTLKRRFRDHGGSLFEHAVLAAVRSRLQVVTEDWRTQWDAAPAFAKDVAAANENGIANSDTRDIRRESLGYQDIATHAVLDAVLADAPLEVAGAIREALLSRFHSRLNDSLENTASAAHLAAEIERAFAELRRHRDKTTGTTTTSMYVPLKFVYSDRQIGDAILSCATPTFRPGRLDSLLRRRTVRIVLPRELEGEQKNLRHRCEGVLGARIQDVPPDDREHSILILVEDLFHPAEDITGIYDYRNAYNARANAELFHIDYRLTKKFPDLLASTGAEGPILCGNDCDFDLRGVPRTTLLCPACVRPIRNRCGNVCQLNDLASHDHLDEIIRAGACPACRKPLATYWWQCPRHGRRVSMEKVHCPECVRERHPHPHVRPGSSDRYTCPNCPAHLGGRPFVAEDWLARACRHGANGHEQHNVEKAIASSLSEGGMCPKCGTQLIPYCPLTTLPRHFMHQPSEADRWCCYVHPELELFACSVCNYPVQGADPACPRCQTSLINCAHCTGYVGLRVPANVAIGRCVRCRLPLDGRSAAPATDDLFCSNIFICPAGSRLDELTFPKGLETCPLCSDLLRPVFARADLVSSCKFCRQLFPLCGSSSSQNRLDAGVCPLCWQSYSETSQHKLSEEELVVARALLDHRDDRKAMRQMYERTSAELRLELGDVLIALGNRIARGRHAKRIAQRVRDISDLLAALVPGAPTGSSSETMATPVDTTPHVTPHRRVDQLMSLEHMLELRSDDAVAEWVDELLSLKETTVSIRAALGTTLVDKHDDVRAHRLQEFRAAVSRRLDEIDHLGK